MSIKAIDNISAIHNTERISAKKQEQNDTDYEQVTVVMSKDAAKALRQIATGLMLLGASAGVGAGLSACDSENTAVYDTSEQYTITNTGDTVPIPRSAVDEGYYNFINRNY